MRKAVKKQEPLGLNNNTIKILQTIPTIFNENE